MNRITIQIFRSPKLTRSLLAVALLLLTACVQRGIAQSGALDVMFNPGTGANYTIRATSRQTDGKIIIGGDFTSYNGASRNYIARLNADGSLDATFDPGDGPDDAVLTTSLQSDEKCIVGGYFTSYDGVGRNSITRLHQDGSLDASFNPGTGTNSSVFTTAIQGDGKIIIGGDFTSYDGTSRNRIARLHADGSLDASFNTGAGANGVVHTTSIQSDGKIIIGGSFTSYDGVPRNRIARLELDGSLDASFNPGTGASDFGPYANVLTTSVQSDGKIIIGGFFTVYNGTPTYRIARVNADGSLDASFNTGSGANGNVFTTAIQSDGKVIIAGDMTAVNSVQRIRIARLNADGSLDACFNPGSGASGTILTTSILNDGNIIIAGNFSTYDGTSRNRIARIIGVSANSSPSITSNPESATKCAGESVLFLVQATGTNLSYQWRKNGNAISGATSDSYTIASVAPGDAGSYDVVVSGACMQSQTSSAATLTVNPDVDAGMISGATSLCTGSPETFTSSGTAGGIWSSSNSAVATVHPSSGLVTPLAAGTTDISYAISSGCGSPETATITVQVNSCQSQMYCTYTQGYYGNSNRIGFINTLLPITVGKPGRSLTFETSRGACVSSVLPAGGESAALPASLGDYSVGTSSCPTNAVIPLLSSNRFNNVLLGQTITLTLNTKHNPSLSSFVLPASFCTQADPQSSTTGPYVIPAAVLSALSNLSLPNTVGGLVELANRALAGEGTGGASLANINNAINAINVGFDECRSVVICPSPKQIAQNIAGTVRLHQNYPNPFSSGNSSTTIRYTIPAEGLVTLRVFDALGRRVAELVNDVQPAGSYDAVFHARGLPSGTYMYRIENDGAVRTGMMRLTN